MKHSQTRRTKPKIPKKISDRYLYNAGLYYLKRYTASCAHFKTVMGRKIKTSCAYHTDQDFEACSAMLDSVTARLVDEGFLNDTAYTRGMVTSLRRRGRSKQMIFRTLQAKGLDRDLIADTLAQIDQAFMHETSTEDHSADMKAALIHARRKKIGPYAKERTNENPLYKRGLASLARAGFSYDIARRVMDYDPDEL